MFNPLRVPVVVAGSVMVIVLAGAACTSESVTVPSARAAADEFFTAWTERDAEAMAARLAEESASRWDARRIARAIRDALRSGDVDSYRVDAGDVGDPAVGSIEELERGVSAAAEYSVTYESTAANEPIVLSGALDMSLRGENDEWSFEWSRGSLWPGIEDAAGFEVAARWPRRAPIVDRRGRVLARGSGRGRTYPFGSIGGTTVGHVEPLDEDAAARLGAPHARGDIVGASGLELAYEERLAGEPATKVTVVDRRGRPLEVVGRDESRPGRPVRATLDIMVQRAAENAYGATTGGAVVMDPVTGDLLALVSSPFDPNNYVGVAGVEPFDRARSGLYPPGSAMKVITAAAALDTRTVTPRTHVTGPADYQGVRNFESGVFGTIDFATAVKFSVNTAFAQVAEELGARAMTRYARRFGFNRKPAMDLDAATSSFPRPEDLADLMWGSIGQAQVLTTPLQMVTASATIANDGVRMEPRATFLDDKVRRRAVSRRTAATMNRLMQGVVQGGTGTAASSAGVAVAGKTGTAEVTVDGRIQNHAWFTAFAPASSPEVAVAVVVEFGGVGGKVAAPLAGSILRSVLPLVR